MIYKSAPFPISRPRRLRQADWMRDLVRENEVSVRDLIWPIFVRDGDAVTEPVKSMPGVNRYSIDKAATLYSRNPAGCCCPERSRY